jgi:hypothetical protein
MSILALREGSAGTFSPILAPMPGSSREVRRWMLVVAGAASLAPILAVLALQLGAILG